MAKDRLNTDTWIRRGLEVLGAEGPGSLHANSLAKALQVSRGSFYWHFDSLEHFHSALLTRWKEQTTEAAIAALATLPEGSGRLEALIARVLASTDPVEPAIRRWAGSSALVARALAIVDETRLQYVRTELLAAGVTPDQADARAAILVWASAGRSLAPELGKPDPGAWAASLAAIFSA